MFCDNLEDLEALLLSKICQTQKDKYFRISFVWEIYKSPTGVTKNDGGF